MVRTGVADKDHPLLSSMVSMTIVRTWLYCVVVVEAIADRKAFDKVDTHDSDGVARWGCWSIDWSGWVVAETVAR